MKLPTRLPRRLKIGPYVVEVVLVTQTTLRDVMDDEHNEGLYNGCWESLVGDEDSKVHGRIYILQTLPTAKRWETFWHEARHAMVDLEGWDRECREVANMLDVNSKSA